MSDGCVGRLVEKLADVQLVRLVRGCVRTAEGHPTDQPRVPVPATVVDEVGRDQKRGGHVSGEIIHGVLRLEGSQYLEDWLYSIPFSNLRQISRNPAEERGV